MARNTLTQSRLKELLSYDPETGLFVNRIERNPRAKQGCSTGYANTIGYVVIQIDREKFGAHRLAWLYMTGEWPIQQIDHINRIRSDNRFSNLRQATFAENCHNMSVACSNTSGHQGVTWHKGRQKWQAQLAVQGRHFYLGMYDDIDEAVAVRRGAVRLFHPSSPEV